MQVGVGVEIEIGIGIGIEIEIEINLARESAGEVAEIVEPPVRWLGLLLPGGAAWPATLSAG